MFGEINQRERQILYAITKYLASQCILQKKNKLTDIKNKLVFSEEIREGQNRGWGLRGKSYCV